MNQLAIIILNYNSAENTIFCVNQLLSFHSDFHIIVVDNNSSDNSFSQISEMFSYAENVDVISTGSNGGYSAGNNYGMRYAIEKYGASQLSIMNPDVIIPHLGVLETLSKTLQDNNEIAVISGMAISAENTFSVDQSAWHIPSAKQLLLSHLFLIGKNNVKQGFRVLENGLIEVGCVAGCFFITKTRFMQDIGFLDEGVFLYQEENILGIKCKRAGFIEAIDLSQQYIHNHVHRKGDKVSLKKKLNGSKINYESRKYVCKTFYSKKLLPILWCIERINIVYLFFCYLKNLIVK